ncbi:protein ZBED8 [Octopus bimaculoides]|uniref:protein ZBED8 n=1 Tax=Octopus bimaculoides TaxID=37653 RepID=UPI0022E4E51C|nr:protein ZBED8 [Octopus bimaculoides]
MDDLSQDIKDQILDQQKADLHDKFQSEGFQLSLAYLLDIFEALNAFDLKLQEKNIKFLTHYDTIRIFMAKLDLWKCRIQQGNTASFSYLDSALIHDIDKNREAWKFIRNPFHCEVPDVLDEVQEEFLELKFNSSTKEDFKELDLETLWINYLPVYPLISHQALRILATFGSTYLCEAAFSTLIAVKTKYRNRLNVERDLHCALPGIQPRIQDLVAKKQCQEEFILKFSAKGTQIPDVVLNRAMDEIYRP